MSAGNAGIPNSGLNDLPLPGRCASEWGGIETGPCLYDRDQVLAMLAAERNRGRRIAEAAQAVTTGCEDRLDYFEVPSHLMAALALALDEGRGGAEYRNQALSELMAAGAEVISAFEGIGRVARTGDFLIARSRCESAMLRLKAALRLQD